MGISAIALLRIQKFRSSSPRALRVETLDDAVLVYTGVDFSAEPAALSKAVRTFVGDALDGANHDPRGIFFIPDVVVPASSTYDSVIEEIGEGGVWGPLPVDRESSDGGLEALLSGVLGQMPSSVLAAASAAMQDNPGAVQAAASQLKGLMGAAEFSQSQAAAPGMGGLAELLSGAGIDFSSPHLQELASQLQAQLERDPAQLANFAERLFGQHAKDEDDE